jgi:hypothetical protein
MADVEKFYDDLMIINLYKQSEYTNFFKISWLGRNISDPRTLVASKSRKYAASEKIFIYLKILHESSSCYLSKKKK